MEQKWLTRATSGLFGGMLLIFTVSLFTTLIRRPDLIGMAKNNMPVPFYAGIVLLGAGWVVLAGLLLGRGWARVLTGIAAVAFLVKDFFSAAAQLSSPLGPADDAMAALSVRVIVVGEVLLAVWGLTLLYLVFSSRPAEPVASSISVEVLNTK